MFMANSLRDFSNSSARRKYIETKLKLGLEEISNFSFPESMVEGKNIENLIGATQIPLGIAGPIKIQTLEPAVKNYYIPLATTEGALVASVSRGCKAVSESGGVYVAVNEVGVTRAPVFKTSGIKDCIRIKKWIGENYEQIKKTCEQTSSHLKLLKIESTFSGKNLFVRFSFNSSEAMGMNMATIACEKAVQLIEKANKIKCISLSGNFDIDKKPAWINFISGRGKKVWAEAIISKKIIKEILKTTPEKIVDLVYRKVLVGSAMAGSIGFNAHYANIIAGVFAATGQDLGQVVEGSLGITSAEITESGDLYFSIHLPSLMVGIIGGGTNLPTQKEALGVIGANSVLEFAEVIAGAVLAGELSLLASQAEGTLAISHIKLGRKNKGMFSIENKK